MAINNKLLRSKYRHTRLQFTPLSWTCTLKCATEDSPATQTYNAVTGEYDPDRTVSPTVILPILNVTDKDGVFGNGNANARLSLDHLEWIVNGEPIADLSNSNGNKLFTKGTNYDVMTTADENRGALVLSRNVDTSESFTLIFKGQFEDWRTGTIIKVKSSNTIVLTTSDKGEDEISISCDASEIIYNPLDDKLLLYHYMLSKGLTPGFTQNSCYDGKQYDRTVTLQLTQGKEALNSVPSGLNVGLFLPNSNSPLIVSNDHPEFVSLSYPQLRLDLRMIDGGEFEVALFRTNPSFKKIAHCSISILRKMPDVDDAFPNFGTDINVGQQRYFNEGTVIAGGNVVDYPELYYHLEWLTQAVKAKVTNGVTTYTPAAEIARQWGERMECDVNDIGIGVTKNDNYFDVFFDVYARGKHEQLSDGPDILTDENGEILIGTVKHE